jgi:hypothetical protein
MVCNIKWRPWTPEAVFNQEPAIVAMEREIKDPNNLTKKAPT